jgi:hypothetical protein
MRNKLRVGILIDNENIPLWVLKVIEKIANSESSEIILFIKKNGTSSIPCFVKYSLGYRFHEKLDQFLFKNKFDYNRIVALTDSLNAVQRIVIDSDGRSQTEKEISDISYSEILKYNLDIILNFSSCLSKEFTTKLAKYGICSFSLGDSNIIRGFSNSYWETVKKLPEIGVTIKITVDPNENDSTIYRSWLAIYSNSLNINRDRLYNLISVILLRILNGLYIEGSDYIHKLKAKYENPVELFHNKYHKAPSTLEALFNLLTIILRLLYNRFFSKRNWNWFLLYRINNRKTDIFPANLNKFESLKPKKDRFWADPFVISRDNKYYLFIEELIFKTNKGHISVIELDEKGKLLRNDIIIEKPYHMSYPFVFEWNDTYYLVPETGNNKTIDLYKCTHFPLKWNFEMNLMENVSAKDSTLFYYHDKWWLFTAINEMSNSPNHDELFLFYSSELLTTKWIAHPCNPIISDIKTARPAGKIFIHDNKIYRPSQDCSGRYGRAFNLCQIITLTETAYEEILVSKVEANWNKKLKGTHTFNFDQKFTIIDAYCY